jgi:hypothetical protein
MNSWRFNSIAAYIIRFLIANYFKIHFSEVYKKVKTMETSTNELPRILTSDGKIYEITLKEIK